MPNHTVVTLNTMVLATRLRGHDDFQDSFAPIIPHAISVANSASAMAAGFALRFIFKDGTPSG